MPPGNPSLSILTETGRPGPVPSVSVCGDGRQIAQRDGCCSPMQGAPPAKHSADCSARLRAPTTSPCGPAHKLARKGPRGARLFINGCEPIFLWHCSHAARRRRRSRLASDQPFDHSSVFAGRHQRRTSFHSQAIFASGPRGVRIWAAPGKTIQKLANRDATGRHRLLCPRVHQGA